MRSAMQSLRRTPYQTAAAMLVLYFTLFLIGILFISITFLYGLLNFVETQPQVTVYFQTDTTEEEIFQVRDELEATGKVASIKYISKEEAFKIYKELTKDNPLLVEMTSASILPASLEIYATRPSYLPEIAEFLKNKQGVDEVQFQEIIVDRLLQLTSGVKNATLILFGFLVLMSTVVIIATSSFKIALRKDEIEILQLLGASNFFIVKPYLAEGILLGVLSSVFSMATLIGVYAIFGGTLQEYLRGIPNFDFSLIGLSFNVWPLNPMLFLVTFGITTLFGATIGFFANFMAARKYLS